MRELYERLGVSVEADQSLIKQAYRKRALNIHPDKQGSTEDMQRLNEAYRLLTNPEELKKYLNEHPENSTSTTTDFLNFDGERPSESYRRWFQAMLDLYTHIPTESIGPVKRENAFSELNRDNMKGLLPNEYYRDLYRVKEDGIVCEDVFQYITHLSKWSVSSEKLPADFFKKSLTFEKGLVIFNNFLEGKYYGKNLEAVKNYLSFQISFLKDLTFDVLFYKALHSIISSKSLIEDHKTILNAVDQMYSYIYQTRAMQKSHLISLIQSKYFRYFIASALKYDWQDTSSKPKEMLQNIKSDFTYLSHISPMSKIHLAIEEKLQSLFSESTTVNEIYECAYLLIDLMASSITSASVANAAFTAALCFQYASTLEIEQPKVLAAEFISLSLYQNALERGFNTNVILGSYIATQAIKCLGSFKYDQSTLTIEEITAHLTNPGDANLLNYSGSVTSSVRGAIRKALDAVDIAPFYSKIKSTLDLEIITIFQLAMLRESLNLILSSEEKIGDFKYAKVVYQAYELALQGWCEEKEESKRQEKTLELKMKAMEALLEDSGSDLFQLSTLVGPGFTHMKRDPQGWFEPSNQLNFPEEAGIDVFSKFKGFKFNRKKKTLEFITETHEVKDPTTGEMVKQKLFTSHDISQMMKKAITDVEFSLDAPGSELFNPLQKVVVRPNKVKGTGYFETLFMVDYLLKMFSTGVEISGETPYLIRTTEQLLARLPTDLKDALNLLRNENSRGHQAHRFWISSKEEKNIEYQKTLTKEGDETWIFGKVDMEVKKHLLKLKFDSEGNLELEDAKIDSGDDSAEAKFAKLITENFDRIGEYFPEFLRFKELFKIAGAMKQLNAIRSVNNFEKTYREIELADEAQWQIYLKTATEENTQQLKDGFSSLPPLLSQLRPLTDTVWWQGKYNTVLAEHLSKLRTACQKHPKFVFQLHDSEITEIWNKQYPLIYNDYFNQLFEGNKQSIIAEHGQSAWDSNEANIRQQVTTAVSTAMPNLLSRQKIQEGLNQIGAKNRVELKNIYYQQLLSLRDKIGESSYSQYIDQFIGGNCQNLAAALANDEIVDLKAIYNKFYSFYYDLFPQLRQRIGENAYKNCIEQFLQGNYSLLANERAKDQILNAKQTLKSQIAEKQELENMFLSLEFGSDASADEENKDQTPNYLVPAAYYCHKYGESSYRVYGGVRGRPAFWEVSQLSRDLSSPFTTLKESSIWAAESFISKAKYVASSCILIGSAYAVTYSELNELERKVSQAKSDLRDLARTELTYNFASSFDNYNSQIHKLTYNYLNPVTTSVNVSEQDPFVAFRLQEHYQRAYQFVVAKAEEERKKQEEQKRQEEVKKMRHEESKRQEEEKNKRILEAAQRAKIRDAFSESKPSEKNALFASTTPSIANSLNDGQTQATESYKSDDIDFFKISPLKIENKSPKEQMWYRGDLRNPGDIFKVGFKARGKDMDILRHTLPEFSESSHAQSGYISTSSAIRSAMRFPFIEDLPKGTQKTYLYEVAPRTDVIDVVKVLAPEVARGKLSAEEFTFCIASEKEM
ncbi:MAG: DnaJ domain-containing protein, partial [Tatlockia sp.]|nr:DnaJ domain-containing protein [Tatlockia sp.]